MLRFLLCFLLLDLAKLAEGWWLLSSWDPIRFSNQPSLCGSVPGLTSKQRQLCARYPNAMRFLVEGIQQSISECQLSFSDQLWNCSLNENQMQPLQAASRESAFVYALSSAGVSHAIAKACAKGLIEDCGCGPLLSDSNPLRSQRTTSSSASSYYQQPFAPPSTQFSWSGCSDNVRFGNSFGRKFLDAGDRFNNDVNARWLMNVHNNRVGRRAMANSMRTECKCHGVSGSCVTKTCWKVVDRLSNITLLLRKKYDNAQQVTVKPNSNSLIVRSVPNSGKGRMERYLSEGKANRMARNELIYLDPSPDYCNSVNTSGRECGDNCSELCCGRGWRTVRELVDEPCHCQFIWCCEVKCDICKKVVDKSYCR